MKANPMRMLWMMPAGWPDHLLLRVVRWAQKSLSKGRPMERMNKFTLLDDAVRGFVGAAAERRVGEAGRRQRLAGVRDPGGASRHLFGVGEGPTEAVAGAKQVGTRAKRKQFVKKFVSEQWILSCKSLGRPLVYHL